MSWGRKKIDSRVDRRSGGVVSIGQAGDELVQLPQPGADGLAMAEVLDKEEDAEEQVEKSHLPVTYAGEQQEKQSKNKPEREKTR